MYVFQSASATPFSAVPYNPLASYTVSIGVTEYFIAFSVFDLTKYLQGQYCFPFTAEALEKLSYWPKFTEEICAFQWFPS